MRAQRARITSGVASAFAAASCAVALLGAERAAEAQAEKAPVAETPASAATEMTPADVEAFKALTAAPRGFVRVLGALEFGDGLRFNNPYRLSSELGSTAQSVSRTASYIDFAAAITYGPARGLAHGLAVHVSFGLEGVSQQVVTPSYIAEARSRDARWLLGGRFGTPIVMSPDPGIGFELAFGATYFLTGKLGVGAELVGDLFYGAGTPTTGSTTYPVLSMQFGAVFAEEFLP